MDSISCIFCGIHFVFNNCRAPLFFIQELYTHVHFAESVPREIYNDIVTLLLIIVCAVWVLSCKEVHL